MHFINIYLYIIILLLFVCNISALDQHYNLHLDNVKDIANHRHICMHDELNKKNVVEQYRKVSSHNTASLQSEQPHPFKFAFNSTYLYNHEARTCYKVGQIVNLGKGNNLQNCSVVRQEPCAYQCQESDVLTTEFANMLSLEIMPYIVDTFGDYLTTTRTSFNSYPDPNYHCYDEDYIIDVSKGFNADYMIYITSHPIPNPNVIAYATYCLLHSDNDAPYLGIINFNPSYFSPFANQTYRQNNLVDWNEFLRVALHEAVHTLGFDNLLYDNFRDPKTGKKYDYPVYTNQTYVGISPNGTNFNVTRFFLNTPNVRDYVSNYFGCQDNFGAELENNGGSGTVGSHWKATRFGEELMLGYSRPVSPFTGLTLALLKDTGWYGINNKYEEQQTIWGKLRGCDFLNKPCSFETWNPYWSGRADVNSTYGLINGCSATRVGRGRQLWGSFKTELAPHLQHFSNPKVGGSSFVFDYCSFSMPTDYCFDVSLPVTVEGEVYGNNSACFTQVNADGLAYGCRPQRCNGNILQFQFENKWYDCQPNTVVHISNTTIIICPDENDKTCHQITFNQSSLSYQVNYIFLFVFLIIALLF